MYRKVWFSTLIELFKYGVTEAQKKMCKIMKEKNHTHTQLGKKKKKKEKNNSRPFSLRWEETKPQLMPQCKDFSGILTSLFSWLMHSKAKGLVRVPHILLPHCRSSPHQTEVPPWESHHPKLPHSQWGESKSDASQTSAEVESGLGRAESSSRFATIHMLLPCEPRAKSTPAAFPGLLKAPL